MAIKRETAQQKEARTQLCKFLKPGDTVYGIVRTVSRSGMSRTIDFLAMPTRRGDRHMLYLSGYIGTLLGYNRDRSGALKVTGCGMDMIFHTVYNLATVLFADFKGKDAAKLPERVRKAFGRMGYYDNGEWVPDTTIRETGYLLKAEQL